MDEEERNSRALTRQIALFPILIVSVAAATCIYPLMRFVPKFEQMFKEMDVGALPPTTVFVFAFANILVTYWYMFFAAYIFGAHQWVNYVSRKRGKVSISMNTMTWIGVGLFILVMFSLQLIFWALMEPMFVIFDGLKAG